ncbi:WW domain-containing oxidoreductase [Echinococcus granulosus]|uniref:WW domain-containing oxidoreductase n=1 Tax=Echinococcus granulosus TaxID=6210 RepID=W6UI71_ECHGR|nr:WW domain-containing oxidoreductase [Echinococcus granulosus]EUB57797.1 WW domain-containing oxidoreductase [Echinococcus granulosus]
MFDSDCEDVLPLDWQAEVDEENGVFNRHPLIGAKLFLPPMPKHWLKVTTDQECSVFINLKTGAQSYADPRLALPLLRTPGGNPTQYPKFDDLSTIAEVLNDCDVPGKYIIILGGTSGVGAYLARSLASRGSIVTCLSRNPPSGRWFGFPYTNPLPSPSNGSLFWTHLDLSSMQSIFGFAEMYNKTSWPVHSLVLAAATLPESFENQKSTDGFDRVVQVNLLSQVLLVRLLQHRLNEATRSTVVFVSCEALRATNIAEVDDVYPALEPLRSSYSDICGRVQLYANTKFLQVLFALAFREFLQRRKRRYPLISVCSPGNLIRRSKLISSASWTRWWWLKCLRLLAYPLSKSMECSAATLALCALHYGTDTSRGRKNDSPYFNGCIPVSLPEAALDPEMTRATWTHVNALLEERFQLPSWR